VSTTDSRRLTPRASPATRRATPLAALLALTLGVAAMLAYEAHDAARSHTATAQRALRDEASLAGWELLATAASRLERPITDALGPATALRAGSAFEALPSPLSLLPAVQNVLPCPGSSAPSRLVFRLDFRDGSYAVAPSNGSSPTISSSTTAPATSSPFSAWVRAAVDRQARIAYRPDWRFAALLAPRQFAGQAVVYAVKYAEHGAPIAAFGFTTCASAFGRELLSPIVSRHALLPALAAGATADSLLGIVVTGPGGDTLYRSGAPGPYIATGDASHPALAGVTAHVGVRPAAVSQLAIAALPTSRVPLLIGLLALTAALAATAVWQLRRDQELTRLRADFVSSVSHELRTPLSQILLFAETLRLDRVRSEGERREAADVIVQEAQRLRHLVDNVLHVARSERRLTTVTLESVDLAPLVRRVVGAWQPVSNHRSTVRLALDSGAVARCDPDAVRQMLNNVLDNAEKYGLAGQTITVGLATAPSLVRLWIEDEGPGIPEALRDRVWEPFVRLPRDVQSAVAGSGIGLFVVKELASAQGATVSVDSAPSGGARFIFAFPAARATAARLELLEGSRVST